MGATTLDRAREVCAERARAYRAAHDFGNDTINDVIVNSVVINIFRKLTTRGRVAAGILRSPSAQQLLMPCDFCDDTGWKPLDENGVRRVVRCECKREQAGHQRLASANIPKRYQHCTIANFTAYNESLKKASAIADRKSVV